jgi:hypothetical protein
VDWINKNIGSEKRRGLNESCNHVTPSNAMHAPEKAEENVLVRNHG